MLNISAAFRNNSLFRKNVTARRRNCFYLSGARRDASRKPCLTKRPKLFNNSARNWYPRRQFPTKSFPVVVNNGAHIFRLLEQYLKQSFRSFPDTRYWRASIKRNMADCILNCRNKASQDYSISNSDVATQIGRYDFWNLDCWILSLATIGKTPHNQKVLSAFWASKDFSEFPLIFEMTIRGSRVKSRRRKTGLKTIGSSLSRSIVRSVFLHITGDRFFGQTWGIALSCSTHFEPCL